MFALALSGLMLNSCSIENKLAMEFVHSRDSIALYLIRPEIVFKTNLKEWQIQDFDKMTAQQQDSALLANTLFLNEIDDTLILNRFFSSFSNELSRFGFLPFEQDNLADFLSSENRSYQVALVQTELEEDVYPYRAEEVFYDSVLFYEDFLLNTVNINVWFDIARLNEPTASNNLLYSSHYVMDQIEGRFVNNLFTREVKYKYNLFPMKTENVYALMLILGKTYAGYVFDYLMNEYVHRNFTPGKKPKVYLHFDPETGKVYPAGDERFVFLKE